MYVELIQVPGREPGYPNWHVLVTEPYQWRVEFACGNEQAARTLYRAFGDVTGAIMEPAE